MSENVLVAVIAFAAGLTTTWGSVYLAHRFQVARDLRLSERDTRLQAFAALMGLRRVVTQLYMSRFEAYIFSDYHENLWRLAGYPKDSLDSQEGQRWMHKSEDLSPECAKADQQLFETVAKLLVSFPASQKLTELADVVYHHKTPSPPIGADKIDNIARLTEWKSEGVRGLKDAVHQELEAPIEALIAHIRQHTEAER